MTLIEAQDLARAQIGKPYLLGAKWSLVDPDPLGPVDCSGYTRWLFHQVHGLLLPDGSYDQIQVCIPDSNPSPMLSMGFYDPGTGVDHVITLLDELNVIEARGNPYNAVITRPRARWEAQSGFLGWYRPNDLIGFTLE